MLFSRIVYAVAFFFTFGALALAKPLEARQTTSITSVLDQLQATTNVITPQLQALSTNGSASDATVGPLINELVVAINTANTDLSVGSISISKRDDEAIAILLAGIIRDITETLDLLLVDVAIAVPALSGLLITVDVALNGLLSKVELLLAGVLKLVASLLVDVAGLLQALSFGLVLAALGF